APIDVARRTRPASADHRAVRSLAARAPGGPGHPVRRALHDRPRAADTIGNRRGCARGGASPLELPRVVERRPGVMPPKPGPPPRQVSPHRIRRLGAFGGILLVVLIVFAIVKIAG